MLDEEGNRYSAGITEYLVEKGHHVHLVTRWNALFHKLAQTLDQPVVYGKLPGDRFQATLNSWVSSFENGKVDLYQLYTGETETLDDIDTVVLAVRHLPAEALYLSLRERHPKVHRVGDCQAPRKTDHAIFEGFLAGREEFDNWTRYVEPGALEQFDPTLPERLKVLQA